MTFAETQSFKNLNFLLLTRSFLIWTFMLCVCFLVVGFPVIALMVTAGALLAIALQSVLPVSAVLLVVGSIIGANLLVIALSAAVLTSKGVYPHEVTWLSWLATPAQSLHTSIYAACPLTCDLKY